MPLDDRMRSQISELIDTNRVVLFMKGTRSFPQCGFSATVVGILNDLVPEYHTVNVLKDPDIREGIKEFSSWPTIPQLYVDGKFVGGCDIVREMYSAGELQGLLGVKDETKAPAIAITPAAQKALTQAQQGQEGVLRLGVTSRFEHELSLDEQRSGDFEIDAGGVKVLIDRMSAKRADGIRIDYTSEGGGGFRIDNPNEPPRVKGIKPAELKRMLETDAKVQLIDVRTPKEQDTASIAGGKPFEEVASELEDLDRETPLVFFCHHGNRSRNAAEQFVKDGWKRVFNLEGGIDAWSQDVDPKVPRY
jgi:monothiol glutaredoxin